MNAFVGSRFSGNGQKRLGLVGGKGLHLGELSKIEGIRVPEGFCVTTIGYQRAIEQNETYQAMLNRLTMLSAEDRDQMVEISRKIRQTIMEVEIPSDVVTAVTRYLSRFGEEQAYAVRSSATAEDLPHASFAGQQDTYLNIIGVDAIFATYQQMLGFLVYRSRGDLSHAKWI